MKILALDIGDVWTGSAISDSLGITARPYKTVKTIDLNSFINSVIEEEECTTIVIGYPKTMGGTESEQTKKVVTKKTELELTFPNIRWVFWDERLSSKQAEHIKRSKTKEDKIMSHSVAAAVILTGYLLFNAQQHI